MRLQAFTILNEALHFFTGRLTKNSYTGYEKAERKRLLMRKLITVTLCLALFLVAFALPASADEEKTYQIGIILSGD